jgi:hypothetical protein
MAKIAKFLMCTKNFHRRNQALPAGASAEAGVATESTEVKPHAM